MSYRSWKEAFFLRSPAPSVAGQVPAFVRRLEEQGYSLEQVAEVQKAFDYKFYASYNDDVVQAGWDLLDHYLTFGSLENRWPTPDFNPRQYTLLNPDVARAGVEPFVHYVVSGRAEGRAIRVLPPEPRPLPPYERSVATLSSRDALDGAIPWCTLVGFKPVDVARTIRLPQVTDHPILSVVIPVHNEIDVTLEGMLALSQMQLSVPYEVIVVDDASEASTLDALREIHGITLLELDKNVGYPAACNIGASHAQGEFLLLLNSDVQVAPDCVERLMEVAEELGPSCGILGPVLLNSNGSIQEIGATVLAGAHTSMNASGEPPRSLWQSRRFFEVDYVSGAVMLIRRDAVRRSPLLDEKYQGGYYEDVDLCVALREDQGLPVHVVTSAYALHHLSRSMRIRGETYKLLRSRENRARFVMSRPKASFTVPVRNVAFYLPQFHPIPENDQWWGAGFTEWTNVSAARPVFTGHEQPRIPSVLGHYSLDDTSVLERQAEMARKYGVDAFCFYYYSFSGHNPLRKPLDNLLATPSIEMTYCLCWANEDWVRSWDGGSGEKLLAQIDSDDNTVLAAKGMVKHLQDPRYLRVNGRPLILVYRPALFQNSKRSVQIMRNVFAQEGIPEVEMAYVESMELAERPVDPEQLGFDMSVEFPPHGLGVKIDHPPETPEGFSPSIYGYSDMIARAQGREPRPWLRAPGVTPRWDNTPRRGREATVFIGSSPEGFYRWLKWAHGRAIRSLPASHRLVFMNAWNEWGEGAYLEPDTDTGFQYLEAIARVRADHLVAPDA